MSVLHSSLSPKRPPPKIHAFLTSKEAYLMAGQSDINSSLNKRGQDSQNRIQEERNESNREIVMAKRQAKRIGQLMGEDIPMREAASMSRMNLNYKKRASYEKNRNFGFQGAMSELIQRFKDSEQNLQQINQKSEKHISNSQSQSQDRSHSLKNIVSQSALFEENCDRKVEHNEINKSYSQPSKSLMKKYMHANNKSAESLDEKNEELSQFQNIIWQTQSLCEEIIPDIKLLAKTKKMQDKQFKTEKIKLIEIIRNGQQIKERGDINSEESKLEREKLHPFYKFLGYWNEQQIPNISKWPKMEQVESRFLFQQYLSIEKKSFQQIKDENDEESGKNQQILLSPKRQKATQHSPNKSTQISNQFSKTQESIFDQRKSPSREVKPKSNFFHSPHSQSLKSPSFTSPRSARQGTRQIPSPQLTPITTNQNKSMNQLQMPNSSKSQRQFPMKANLNPLSFDQTKSINTSHQTPPRSILKQTSDKRLNHTQESLIRSQKQIQIEIPNSSTSIVTPQRNLSIAQKVFRENLPLTPHCDSVKNSKLTGQFPPNNIASSNYKSKKSTDQSSQSQQEDLPLQNHIRAKKASMGAQEQIPDIINQMTLNDMNQMLKQAEGMKARNQEAQQTVPDVDSQHYRKGVTQIRRDMLTYQGQKDDILDTWEKKQVKQQQKNRMQIKLIINDHYSKQLQAEKDEELQPNSFFHKKSPNSQQLEEFKKLTSSRSHQQNEKSQISPNTNSLTYEQTKSKDMQLIRQAKQITTKIRESDSVSIPSNSEKDQDPKEDQPNSPLEKGYFFDQNDKMKQNSSKSSELTSPNQNKDEFDLNQQQKSALTSPNYIHNFYFDYKDESINRFDTLDHSQQTYKGPQYFKDDTINNQMTEQIGHPIKQRTISFAGDNEEHENNNILNSTSHTKFDQKQKRKESLKLLKAKQEQKQQVKDQLDQVMARFNRQHNSKTDKIIKQIQSFRLQKLKNEAEVNFTQMTKELQRKEWEFKSIMEGTSEECNKKRKREHILYETQQKIFSSKFFDPFRFFREEQIWNNTINEMNDYTQGQGDTIERAKNQLKSSNILPQPTETLNKK